MPEFRSEMVRHTTAELSAAFEQHGLPFAAITKPEGLFNDVHLSATGGLAIITLPDGRKASSPVIPITLVAERLGVGLKPPRLGEHTQHLLAELGYTDELILTMQTSHTAKILSKNQRDAAGAGMITTVSPPVAPF